MIRPSRVLPLMALALLVAAPARAQIAGTPFELSGNAGWMDFDHRARLEDGVTFGGSLGWRLNPFVVAEGYGQWAPSEADTNGNPTRNFSTLGLDLRWNLRPAHTRVVPYLMTGFGYGLSHSGVASPDKLERGTPSVAVGALVNLLDQRTYLRLQVRDVLFRERDSHEFSNHLAVTGGLHYVLGGKPSDRDFDGVRDWLDQCPDTPLGARVDARGCPVDSDGDKVFDGLDKCEGTPAGCVVDKDGCPLDADGDGVCDGVDQCPNTPRGARVDARGCPTDSDGDGVFDGIDACEGTPTGAVVDTTGCPLDDDRDGVFNGLDECPDTPQGLRVDAKGCPIEVVEKETELLDTGMIRLQDVNFETAKADILPESFPTLDAVGQVLMRWPELRIEVGGHTDSRGTNAYNQRLSEMRARSVLNYLTSKYPTLQATQFSARGYGESRPIATNSTELGRAKNRRVEFVVLNKDVLRREIERRRLLRENEAAPPPQGAPPDTLQRPAPPDTTGGN